MSEHDKRQDQELYHLTDRVIKLENLVQALEKLVETQNQRLIEVEEARQRQIKLNGELENMIKAIEVGDKKPTKFNIFDLFSK